MNSSKAGPITLVILGVLSILIVFVGFDPGYRGMSAGQQALASALTLTISLGFIVTGFLWIMSDSWKIEYSQIPAVTLAVLGIIAILGSLVVFQPWSSGGLAGGLRWGIVALSAVLGGIFALAGTKWAREKQVQYPLALLAGGQALGVFFIGHQQFDLLLSTPQLTVAIAAVVLIPIVFVLRSLSREATVR